MFFKLDSKYGEWYYLTPFDDLEEAILFLRRRECLRDERSHPW